MDERKYFILSAILSSYIENGQAIGSRILKREYNMDVSAATIRNEMSDLEHEGYLEKTHVSSGRIPSEKAFRWYVDELMARGLEDDQVLRLPTKSLFSQTNDPKEVLSNALNLLSDVTGMASFILLPSREKDVLNKIRVIPMSDRDLVLLMVFDSNFIQTDLVHLHGQYSKQRLERAGEILQELLENRKLESIDDFLHSNFFSGSYVSGNVMSELVPLIRDHIRKHMKPALNFAGLTKLFTGSNSGEDSLDFIRKLQNDSDFLEYVGSLGSDLPVSIMIGGENPQDWMQDRSIISVPYKVAGDFEGRIGVLGNVDMHYRRVINDVIRIGRYINSVTLRGKS